MLCGAAKCVITPEPELIPHLSGLGNVTFDGVLDDLYVRVLAFTQGERTILFVSFDFDKVPCPRENLNVIDEQFGIPAEDVVLYSTHTHTAPIGGVRVNEGPNIIAKKPEHIQQGTHTYEAFVTRKMCDTIAQALAAVQPAKLGIGYGESYINMSRLETYHSVDEDGNEHSFLGIGINHKDPCDRTLFVMKIVDEAGAPIAMFVNYPVHNCVMIRNKAGAHGNPLISGDLVGRVVQLLEDRYPDTIVLWSSGAAADINPLFINEMFYPDPTTGQPTILEPPSADMCLSVLTMLSTRHYADIARVADAIKDFDDVSSFGSAVELVETPATPTTDRPEPEPYTVRLHMVRLGDLAFVGASGELFQETGAALKQATGIDDTVVINHDATLLTPGAGYILTDAVLEGDSGLRLPGHRGSTITPGYVQPALVASAQRLAAEIFPKQQ